MRMLSNNEKEYLRELDKNKYSRHFIVSELQDKLKDEILSFDFTQKKIIIKLPQPKSIQDQMITQSKRIEVIENEIIMIVNLIGILEREGYIFLVTNRRNDIAAENLLGTGILSADCCITLPDNDISEYFINLLGRRIIPTQQLIDLIKHGFIPIEDRKYRTTNIIAVVGIVVAILLGLLPIFQSVFFSKSNTVNNKKVFSEINESSPNLK
jgi:hypothetical protein